MKERRKVRKQELLSNRALVKIEKTFVINNMAFTQNKNSSTD